MPVTHDHIAKIMTILEPRQGVKHAVHVLPPLGQTGDRENARNAVCDRLPRNVEEMRAHPDEPNRGSSTASGDSFQQYPFGEAAVGDDMTRAGERPPHHRCSEAEPE